MECIHCKNKFSSLSSLNNHMKTAKYCLGKRGIKNTKYNCSNCQKSFSTKRWCESHENKCGESIENLKSKVKILEAENHTQKKNYENKITEQKATIRELQDKLENIAIKAVQRSTTTVNKTQINNIIQKMEPVTPEHLIDNISNLTLEHVQRGASGYAEYALEYPLKNRVACVDYARRKIKV